MGYDRYSLFYCLTVNGWVSLENDDSQLPEDWVRFYEVKVEQGSGFDRTSRHWQLPKTNPEWKPEDAEKIEKQYPRPKEATTLSDEMLKRIGGQ